MSKDFLKRNARLIIECCNHFYTLLLFSSRFFAKYLKSDFGKTHEENLKVASERFYGLLKKVEAAGEREE